MKSAQMRAISAPSISPSSRWKSLIVRTSRLLSQRDISLSLLSVRSLAQVRSEPLSELWFTSSFPAPARAPETNTKKDKDPFTLDSAKFGHGRVSGSGDHKPPDGRTLKLGRTLRTLSPLLPNILTTPIPPEVLSPHISLHLFPSTHPHLPVVKGRVGYRAALWTAPVAWGCVPIMGNVKLEIMSEKMVRTGYVSAPTNFDPDSDGMNDEKLVVRWRTEQKKNGNSTTNDASASSMSSAAESGSINRGLSTLLGGDRPLFKKDLDSETFTGLFIFSFDSEGRIASHTIEHADENNGLDKTSRVVTLTDWLLGKAKWRGLKEEEAMPLPGLAYRVRVCRQEVRKDQPWR